MLSKRTPRSTPAPKAKPQSGSGKRSVHIVFTSTIELATMKRSEQHIIGIFEELAEAEALEKRFNENAQEANGTVTKAYSIRYGIPYMAPIVKQMLGD